MHGLVSTDSVPLAERADFWRSVVEDHYVAVDLELPRSQNFRGALVYGKLPGLALTRYAASPNSAKRRASHAALSARDDLFCFFARRGEMHLQQLGRTACARAGTFCLIDSEVPFLLDQPSEIDVLVARVSRQALSSRVSNLGLYTCRQIDTRHGLPAIVARFMASISQEIGAIGGSVDRAAHLSTQAIDLLAMCLVAPSATDGSEKESSAKRAQMIRARDRIAAELGDPRFAPAKLASSLGISQRYLHALFAEVGSTPGSAIREARLDRARDLIRAAPDQPIGHIARSVGFASASHFSRAFKARFGVSPRDSAGIAELTALEN
ncbi:Transcriptional activator NphR [Roseivivax jejudonensis]|uniref:Transcriptional activator NphR n=1 Tax=Roseivivax jejudonensis TaxID=1529041 RepID=A0A1X7A6Q2_9RHOB|nr:helix-turn-helix domain-containing protein [Roseivivax jejudonensis]SLN71645.1 Transcriptional activator NphR [Roseivivax jejudonensis]